MKEHTISASLTGLLHNIGIMVGRADPQKILGSGEIERADRQNTSEFTRAFVQRINPAFQKYVIQEDLQGPQDETTLRVKIANLLSLPGAREDAAGTLTGDREHLASIFDRVKMGEVTGARVETHYLPLKPLALDKDHIFPTKPQEHTQNAYGVLVSGLLEEVKKTFATPESFIENILAGLQKYAWCVPSATIDGIPDVSLYDHARMTAALAVCLGDFDKAELENIYAVLTDKTQNKQENNPVFEKPVALLLGGDISGIQDFIYTLSAKRAAKTLRGRSFYLQLLTEAILRFLLKSLDLPYSNVIYSGGGHFFVLLPVSAEKDLQAIQKEITQRILKFHGTSLYVALGWSAVPVRGFSAEAFPGYWGMMHQHLHYKKHQRYTELGESHLNELFSPGAQGGNEEKLCAVCGREHPSAESISDDEEGGGKILVCSLCRSFADQIGQALPKAQFVRLGFSAEDEDGPYTAMGGLAGFGMQVRFDQTPFEKPVDQTIFWKLTDNPLHEQVKKNAVAWEHYVVNELPLDEAGQVINFDELQKKAKGIHRLGVLLMDVDNLGGIFQAGLKGKKGEPAGSLVHLATLSFQISLFFEGYIRKILEKPEFSNLIYSVYSGGDDLFLLGPWHLMPDVALAIVDELIAYTGENPDLHLSGGMSFIHGKYPIHAAAEDAGDLEKDAKAAFGVDKNAFAFLGEIWHWHTFKEVKAHKVQLVNIHREFEGKKSLIHLLQDLDDLQTEAKKNSRTGKPVWGPWMWMGDYQIHRMKMRSKGGVKDALEALHTELKSGDYPYADLHDWAIAARWAELELRKKSKRSE
jgi:CRISPR-associated protein Csm1